MAQQLSFWIELGQSLGKALPLLAWRYVSKRMAPEDEAAWLKSERGGVAEVQRKQRDIMDWPAVLKRFLYRLDKQLDVAPRVSKIILVIYTPPLQNRRTHVLSCYAARASATS